MWSEVELLRRATSSEQVINLLELMRHVQKLKVLLVWNEDQKEQKVTILLHKVAFFVAKFGKVLLKSCNFLQISIFYVPIF